MNESHAASEMNYEVMKVCLILILSLYNYASTFELNNEMSVYDSYGDSVKQFISKVQNFEQNKILQSGEDKLHDMQIRAEGKDRRKRRKRRRKKKRKTMSNYLPRRIQSQVWKCQKSESLLVLFAGRQDHEKFQNTAMRI